MTNPIQSVHDEGYSKGYQDACIDIFNAVLDEIGTNQLIIGTKLVLNKIQELKEKQNVR